MMKILMLSLDEGLLTPNRSDTETRFQDYSTHFDKMHVFVPSKNNVIRRIGDKIVVRGTTGGDQFSKLIRMVIAGVKLCKQDKLNLIVANEPLIGFAGLIIKLVTGVKLNVNVLGLEITSDHWLSQRKIINPLLAKIQMLVLKSADSIRSDSKGAAQELETMGVEKAKISFIPAIPSLVAIKRLKNTNRKFLSTKTKNKLQLLAIGYLIPQKAYDVLLKTFALVLKSQPNIVLTIVGDGPEKNHLQSLSEKLNIGRNVQFAGNINYDQLPDYYRRSDLFVLSSWYEGGPRVVMEAAFSMLPIVSTDVGSVADMLTNGKSAYILAPGKTSELAEKIVDLLKDPKKRLAFGVSARKEIERFCDYKKNTREIISLWEKTAKNTP